MGETVRTNRYRYTAWVAAANGKIIAQELYDHEKDPIESVNMAKNSDYHSELERHEKLRNEGWGRVHKKLKQMIIQ